MKRLTIILFIVIAILLCVSFQIQLLALANSFTESPSFIQHSNENEFDKFGEFTGEMLYILKQCKNQQNYLNMEILKMLQDAPSKSHQSQECMQTLDGTPIVVKESICRHRFLWLSGLHFSGTSLTNYILQTNGLISGHIDTGVPMDEGQHLQNEFPRDYENGDICSSTDMIQYQMDEHHHLASDKVRSCLFTEWAHYWDLSRPILMEKSPASIFHLRYRQWMFPRVTASIVVVRHPLYGCLIHPNKQSPSNFFHRDLIESALHHWMDSHNYLISILPQLDRYAIIMFEDFYSQPDAVSELNSVVSSFFPDVITSASDVSFPDANRRRLPFRDDVGSKEKPEVDISLIMGWAFIFDATRKEEKYKKVYEEILPVLESFEKLVNDFGYSLLNIHEINVEKFNAKFGRKF